MRSQEAPLHTRTRTHISTHAHILVDWSILIISWRLWRGLIRSCQCDWWRHAMLSPRERQRDREEGWSQLRTPLLLCPHLFIVGVFPPCNSAPLTAALLCVSVGKPVMIITEFMENGSLDTFLKVSHSSAGRNTALTFPPRSGPQVFRKATWKMMSQL